MTKIYAIALLFVFGNPGFSENAIVNVKKNTVNSSDGTSTINSGIDLGKGSSNVLTGNGDIKVQARKTGNFSGVDITGAFKVSIVSGESANVSIKGDSNILDKIITKTNGKTLTIKTDGAFSVKKQIEIKLSCPELKKIILNGTCSGNINIKKEGDLKLEITGACKIELSGKLKDLSLSLEGASSFDGLLAPAGNVSVKTSGASKATVVSTGTLDVKASGASSVFYKGSPEKIKKDISIPAAFKKI